MRKKRAIRNFAGIIFLCLIVFVFSIISFNVPNSDYTFMGFIRGINLSIEYQGGTIITYKVYSNNDNHDASKGLDSASKSLEQILSGYQYDANVFKTSDSSMKIQVSFNGIDDECKYVTNIVNLPNKLEFKAKNEDEVFLTSKNINSATGIKNETKYGVYIEFTSEGRANFKKLTEKAIENESKTVEIYIGSSASPYSSFSISEIIDQNYIFISGGMSTQEEADLMAARINSTKYAFSFEEVSRVTISKDMSNLNKIMSLVIVTLVLVGVSVYLYVRFKNLGLCGILAIIIAFLAQILLLLSLPNIVLTPTSFIASLITMIIGTIIVSILFAKMQSEYSLGKKIHASVKFGFAKVYSKIIDALVMCLVPMFLLLIFGTEMAKQFSAAFLVGIVVYGLSCLLFSYLFAKFYVDINPVKAKKYGFKREAYVNEIE